MPVTIGFIGSSKRGPVNDPQLIRRWGQFVIKFGSFLMSKYLAHAVYGFFNNGGSRCYVVNVGEAEEGSPDIKSGLEAFDKIDDIDFVVAPGQTDLEVHDAILSHCKNHGTRFAILDTIGEIKEEEKEKAEESGADEEAHEVGGEEKEAESEAEEGGEGPRGIEALPELEDTEHGLYFFPWIWVKGPKGEDTIVPPSGHIAGLYASSSEEDKHTPPVNRRLMGAISLTYRVRDADQRVLNSRGIECLRFHPKEVICIVGHDTFLDSYY